MNRNSIRWKLPLTYAGIALITVLVLGGTLLAILRGFYRDQELGYLKRNAVAISEALAPVLSLEAYPVQLKPHLAFFAFLSQTRVSLRDRDGKELANMSFTSEKNPSTKISAVSLPKQVLLASNPKFADGLDDSNLPGGLPEQAKAMADTDAQIFGLQFTVPVEAPPSAGGSTPSQDSVRFIYRGGPGEVAVGPYAASFVAAQPGTLISVIPAVGTMYGFDLKGDVLIPRVRSNQVFRQSIVSADGRELGILELSDGPAYGREILDGVARGWLVAGLVAILVAGAAGWWISRRISAPLLALTEVTARMAQGDLSARASTGSEDEFGLLARSFNEMANRVEGTVAALRQFASDAAHELHTPLTALQTNLELAAAEQATREDASGSIRQAWEQMQRLERLTSGLLDLSRIESRAGAAPSERLDVRELVQEASEPFASQAEQGGIDFNLELPEQAAWISGQRGQITRALNNLLSNAVKFTGPGGSIRLGVSCGAEEVCIWVEDSGIGIAEEDLPYVFNRFHRGRNATAYPGSGLGLAIAKAVVEQHCGSIQAARLTAGTRFEARFPA